MITCKENPDKPEDVKELLIPLVRAWFFNKFKEFSLPQLYGVSEVHKRQNILVSAQTGTGKTLTSFLAILNELIDLSQKNILENKIYCVYISPLKALNNDIKVNLLNPLEEMERLSNKKLGVRVAVRTGDTTAAERSKMLKTTPHILITTPESLALILSSPKFADNLKNTTYVIIDEIHSIAESKRGVHLSLSLERLQRLSPGICRIGLSATVAPLDQIAQFLVGTNRDCKIIDISGLKKSDLEVLTPTKNLIDSTFENLSKDLYSLIDKLIQEHKTTLIFTNTRAGTERVVHHLKERFPKNYVAIEETTKKEISLIGAHHGSLSKEHRFRLEDDLRRGKLKAVVCSTSLELGIDIGYIDLVICLGSPKSAARLLQRCLPYDARLLLGDGTYRKIGEIVEGKLDVEVLSYDIKKGFVKSRIKGYHKNRVEELLKINFHSGLSLDISPEHPIFTRRGWKNAKELKIGDEVAELFNHQISYSPYIHELIDQKEFYVENRQGFLRDIVDDYIKKSKLKYTTLASTIGINQNRLQDYIRRKGRKKSIRLDLFLKIMQVCEIKKEAYLSFLEELKSKSWHRTSLPLKLTKDFMWLAGIVASDGAITENKKTKELKIKISNKDKNLLEECQKIFNRFGFYPSILKTKNREAYSLDCGSKLLAHLMLSLGIKIGKVKSHYIEVSDVLIRLPRELTIPYIEGVFEGDGNKDNNIRIFTASQGFAIGFHNLLNRIGIQNYFTHNEAKASKLIKKINSNKIFCIYILRNNQVKTFLRYCILKGKKAKFLLKKKFSHSLKEKDIEDNINWVKVSSIQKTRDNNQVYNITLQNEINTYFVESILTHNCGRSGHKLHEITKGRLVVLDRDDLVECSVMLKSAIERKIDKVHIPTNCLDVLAQQIIGISINEAIDVEELYLLIKNSYCYKDLPKYDFLEIIKYLAGEYTTLEDRHVYARIWLNEGKIGKRGKMARVIYMTNIGTIPDQTGIKVKHKNNFIGTIDESFLEKLERGDIFVLGGNTYQFLFARGMTAEVIPAPGKLPTVPSWFSEMLPLSFDLALEIQRFRKLMSEIMKKPKEEVLNFINEHLYTKKETSEAIYNYFLEQFKFLEIPNEKKLIIEEYRDDNGKTFVIAHSLYGRRVNDCLSRCLAYIILKTEHIDVEVGINDNGFYLSGRRSIKIMRALRILKSENIKTIAEKAIDKSEILKRRFRHCAGRAYMILREYKGIRKYVGRQQVSSMILMSAVKRISNDFPILKEARREVLEDLMDISNAKLILKQIEDNKIEIKEKFTLTPSPFAFNLVSQGMSDILKAESKQEFLQRMHRVVLAKINLKK